MTRWAERPQPYLGTLLVGLAIGSALAPPVIHAIFLSGPLGPLREAALPQVLATAPTWARGLWTALCFLNLFGHQPSTRELRAMTCTAGLAWFSFPLFADATAEREALVSLPLQAVFGALWAAAVWSEVGYREKWGACIAGGLAAILLVGAQVLNAHVRLS
jgi:hypothetical protein